MNKKEKKDVKALNKLIKENKMVYLTFGIPINKIEEFAEKLNSLGMNIYIQIPNYQKKKEAEMLLIDKNKAVIH